MGWMVSFWTTGWMVSWMCCNALASLLDTRFCGTYVVDMLSANSGSNTLAVGGVIDAPLVSKASLVVDKSPLGSVRVTVVELAVLDGTKLGSVSLRKDITILDRLDSTVVVVLVDLLVNSSVDLLVYMRLDDLVLDGGGNCLVDSGVVVARPAHEVGDSCLGLVHFD